MENKHTEIALPNERQAIQQIEKELNISLEKLSEIRWFSVGYTVNDSGEITGIGLCDREVKDLNRIISILKELKSLTSLDLGYNQLTDISALKELKSLTRLELWRNRIVDISALKELKSLTYLELSHNQLTDISALKELKSLTYLDLENNQISDISALKELKSLRSLYLGNNKITEFSDWIRDFPNLKTEFLKIFENNPIENVPVEIIEKGKEAIKAYFVDLEKKPIPVPDIRMILMGNSTAGKTTLAHFLLNPSENPAQAVSTHGIKHYNWFPDELKPLKVCIWDFGDQEFYHATHKYFLSDNVIYVVLWEANTNFQSEYSEKETVFFDFRYWINNIRHFAPQSPILLIQNKIDEQESQNVSDKEVCSVHQISVTQTFEILQKEKLTLAEKRQKNAFEDFLLCLQEKLKEFSQGEIPGFWNDVKNKIIESKSEIIWNFEKYKNICKEIDEEIAFELCTEYLQNRGFLLYYPNIAALKDTVFLDPQYISNTIYEVLQRDFITKAGKFTFSEVLTNFNNNSEKTNQIINLMKAPQFELIFEYPEGSANFIAPQYLPSDTPALLKQLTKPLKSIAFVLFFPIFIPRNIIVRFLSRFGKFAFEGTFWKNGIVLTYEDEEECFNVLVHGDFALQKIYVKTDSQHISHSFIKNIFENLDDINDENREIKLSFDDKNFAPLNIWFKNAYHYIPSFVDEEGKVFSTVLFANLISLPKIPDENDKKLINLWTKKLSFLQMQEVTVYDFNQKFALQESIKECKRKIEELEK